MNISTIDADVDFLCNSTSASYPTISKRRNENIEYHRVATVIWQSDGVWNFDDANNSTTPIAYRTIANASANYLIPTTAIRIEDVEIKDSSLIWHRLRPVTLADMGGISPEVYLSGTGFPIEYMVDGNEIRLFPAPDSASVTLASGMAVRLSRAVTELALTATTTVPGFAVPFHRMLSLAAAVDFIIDEGQRKFLLIQKDRLEKSMINFYSKRNDDLKTRIVPGAKRKQGQYQ